MCVARPAAVSAALSVLCGEVVALSDRVGSCAFVSSASIGGPRVFQPLCAVLAAAGALEAVVLESLRAAGFDGDVNRSPTFVAARVVREGALEALHCGGLDCGEVRLWLARLRDLSRPAF
jgi:hypothetical protein